MTTDQFVWLAVGVLFAAAVLYTVYQVVYELTRRSHARREARAHVSSIEPDDNPLGDPAPWLNDGGTSWLTLDPESPAYKAIHEFDHNRKGGGHDPR